MTKQSAESYSSVKLVEKKTSTARSSSAITPAACALLAVIAGGTLDVLPSYAEAHTIVQSFVPPWTGNDSPDGLWRINGPWNGTNNNEMDPTLAKITASATGQPHGYLSLCVAANEWRGSEIQTLHGAAGSNTEGYGYGYYETNMRVTTVPGVVASFFWIEAPNYGSHEWDVEFTTNESWINSPDSGLVHLTLHPSNTTFVLPLAFNPSRGFHRYGFLWSPGAITFTVDGQAAHTFQEADLDTPAKGFIMANTWTGNPNFGGGPPTRDATTTYAWMYFNSDAIAIPKI